MIVVGWKRHRSQALAGCALAAVVLLAAPAAYALDTAATAHTGSIVTAGPSIQGGTVVGSGEDGRRPGGDGNVGDGVNAPGTGQDGALTQPNGQDGATRGGGAGGLLEAVEPGEELTELLLVDAENYTWAGAAVGANNAAGYQLATEEPVMPLGGFNASDPSPTLQQFQA